VNYTDPQVSLIQDSSFSDETCDSFISEVIWDDKPPGESFQRVALHGAGEKRKRVGKLVGRSR